MAIHMMTPLTDEQLYKVAPSIFAQLPWGEVSDRYTFIPTSTIVAQLRKEGFQPVRAHQSRTVTEGKREFAQHMIRFQHPDAIVAKLNDEIPEIVLRNSHDRTSGFQLSAGMLRLVCMNGMMVKSTSLGDISVRHSGNIVGDIIEGSYSIIKEVPSLMDKVAGFKALELEQTHREIFAHAALCLRYGDNEAPVTPTQLLKTRRYSDQKSDLWTTFNVVQENMMKGGLLTASTDRNGKVRHGRTRSIKSICEDNRINKALWMLTEGMAELKSK